MKMVFLSACLLLTPSALFAMQWQTDDASTLGFSASAQGEDFNGRFTVFRADIRFDPASLGTSRFAVEIDLASVDSANSERDEMLADPAFFNSASEPQASYVASRFSALEDGRFRAEGSLTLRGVSLDVPLDFSWTANEGSATLEGKATLDRLDFKVGEGEWADEDAIARTVEVTTTLKLTAAPASAP